MTLTFRDIQMGYLMALARLRDALVREIDVAELGETSLQSTSDAVCEFRQARQAYCARVHREEEP